jgi:hypothetical protein
MWRAIREPSLRPVSRALSGFPEIVLRPILQKGVMHWEKIDQVIYTEGGTLFWEL